MEITGNAVFFIIRSLTPPQAAKNALAFAVQAAIHSVLKARGQEHVLTPCV
jgi:hypothetical protein